MPISIPHSGPCISLLFGAVITVPQDNLCFILPCVYPVNYFSIGAILYSFFVVVNPRLRVGLLILERQERGREEGRREKREKRERGERARNSDVREKQ